MKLSLVIPCYNEAENLPLLIDRCTLLSQGDDVEVIFVNNGSTDNTKDVLKNLVLNNSSFRIVTVETNQGYGFGVLSGLRSATGDVLAWTHADMQTDPCDVIAGLELFKNQGIDTFVKGRRYGRPLMDVLFTIGMSVFETLLLNKVMWDINAQPTMFSKEFFDGLENPPNDFSLDLYVYYQAKRSHLNIQRFPVLFGSRAYGVSHWNVNFASKWKFIKRTIEFSLQLRRKLN
tara:strand:+ start:10097 stop:10792 length:696 start_codon:yes stop_codon:yes gene_type:complete